MTESVFVKQLLLGPMGNFIYILGDPITKQCAVIDPAWDVLAIEKEVLRESYVISAVILTHGHHDHINGLSELTGRHQVPVYASEHLGLTFEGLNRLSHNQTFQVGKLALKALRTPGHSQCGMCYWVEGHLFSGDTLFLNGCGRCDLTLSDPSLMFDSLNLLKGLPKLTVIYPGHKYGKKSCDSLANQIQTNRFLLCANKKEFLEKRMGTPQRSFHEKTSC
jgi:hydroxyacylglutathione hydrolase